MIEQPKGGDWPSLGTVIEEHFSRLVMAEKVIWEEKLRLHIRPKPSWMPEAVWHTLLSLVLTQSTERR